MGAQGNAERREKSRNTRLIFLLVYLVLRLSVTSSAQQLYEVERAIRAKEREEAQLAEAQSAWDEAMLVQARVTDDRTARGRAHTLRECAAWGCGCRAAAGRTETTWTGRVRAPRSCCTTGQTSW